MQESCQIDMPTMGTNETPLHIAAREGQIRCVESLVGYGADVKANDVVGNTSLHLVLAKRNMKPLSECTLQLNEVYRTWLFVANTLIATLPSTHSSMSMCLELTTVFRMSLSTSLWPVSWSVKEPVWRQNHWKG